MTVTLLRDGDALAAAAAERVLSGLAAAIARHRAASLVLCGGRTPVATFRRIAGSPAPGGDWGRVGIWFADERAVPADHADSNYHLAEEALIAPAGIPSACVHRMPADAPDLEAAAARYEAGFPERADLVILGIGEDGHVASIFPRRPGVSESTRRIAVVRDSPKPPAVRMTITPRVLREAVAVLVLASGGDKAEAVARALAPAGDAQATPARLVRDRDWLLDAAAAARLPRGGD